VTYNAIPTLSVSPVGKLVSSGYVGGSFTPAGITYTLQNPGNTSLKWTASKKQSWISLSAAIGSLAGGASTTVTVSVNSSAKSLAAGSYSDTVSFTNSTNGNGNTTRSVSLTVNPTLSVSPAGGLVSTGYTGGTFAPSHIAYTLQNLGSTPLKWTASKTQSWISISSGGGTLAGGASTTVTASFNSAANSLAAGSYSDTISFKSAGNSITRSASLIINPSLSVSSTGGLVSTGYAGGTFSPSSITYTLQNLGSSPLKWTASKKKSWISLSSSGGTIVVGASITVTVSISSAANSLKAGSYSDTISFICPSGGSTTRSVTLTVNPALSVSPAGGLTSSGPAGGTFTPTGIVYTLRNLGDSPIKWTAGKTQPWISLSSSAGTLAGNASTTVTVSFNSGANKLAEGDHSDTVNFGDSTNQPVMIVRDVLLSIQAQ
jgi:hypothetical protein